MQTDTRGSNNTVKSQKKMKKTKEKKKSVNNKDSDLATNLKELMTKEDEELLHNVEDEDDECDFDFEDEGDLNMNPSEISGFLTELGISKYRPFDAAVEIEVENNDPNSNDKKKQKKQKKKSQVEDSEDIQIKEDPNEKKQKKKKKKSEVENTEIIKDEPANHDLDIKPNIENNEKKQKKNSSVDKATINKQIKETEEKPDLKALKAAMSYMKLQPQKSRTVLLLKTGELWREEKKYPVCQLGPEDTLVKEAYIVAERVLKEDIAQYTKQKENMKRSEARWLKTVLLSGTLSDKIAALTLQIQESPVHNVSSIDSLLSMASKKGRREAMMAVDTLKDLFMTGLLPEDRKLRFFYQFPLYNLWEMTSGNVDQRDRLLLCWYFEDLLKKKYSQFIKIIGEMLFDTLQATKDRAVKTTHELLSSRPEQEHVLLPMLVNKMGDQNVNNKASYLLGKLVEEHPNMKGVIVKEVCQLLYRPNIAQRAQYYAICFLTQIRLSKDEGKLATELIKIYLSFFQTYLKKRVLDSKTMSALLTGVNRAYVYASGELSSIMGEMNEVYKIIPTVNFQTGVQALMLLYHITNDNSNAATRFYSALYRKLNDPALANTTKHAIFLNLIFKSLKRDTMDNRVLAFVKRILQVYVHHPAHVICGVLILLSQVLTSKPELLNLVRKSQASWVDTEDVEKDVDEEEKFVDLPIPAEFLNTENDDGTENSHDKVTKTDVKSSWMHISNKDGQKDRSFYNPSHRNPLYSRAELECLWELEKLTKHFHPTVALYASMLLKGESVQYNGDPLADYTLIRFLDRFVYKNPKKPLNQSSVGAPQQKAVAGIRNIPVNSKEYLKQKVVPEEEQFFLKYFTEKERQKQEKDDDEDSVDDDEFDRFLDRFTDRKQEDFGDYKLDFAKDTAKSKNKNVKKGVAAESESDDDDDDDDDLEDMDFGDDDLAAEFERELQGIRTNDDDDDDEDMRLGDDDEFNEEDAEFSPDENDTLGSMMVRPKGNKRKQEEPYFEERKKKKKLSKDPKDLFASAEEFSHLLEEGIESGSVSLGGIHQMRNQDKAAQKQLAWEEKRDRWINNKGRPFRSKKKVKGKPFSQSGVGGKPRQSFKNKSKPGKKGK